MIFELSSLIPPCGIQDRFRTGRGVARNCCDRTWVSMGRREARADQAAACAATRIQCQARGLHVRRRLGDGLGGLEDRDLGLLRAVGEVVVARRHVLVLAGLDLEHPQVDRRLRVVQLLAVVAVLVVVRIGVAVRLLDERKLLRERGGVARAREGALDLRVPLPLRRDGRAGDVAVRARMGVRVPRGGKLRPTARPRDSSLLTSSSRSANLSAKRPRRCELVSKYKAQTSVLKLVS